MSRTAIQARPMALRAMFLINSASSTATASVNRYFASADSTG